MPERYVMLSARGESAHLELVREGERLFLFRDGERVTDNQWPVDKVNQATEAFHQLSRKQGLI